jgi:hypothetical protein
MAKSPASVPVMAMLLMVIVEVSLFVTVTDFGPPACPTGTFPHVSDVGAAVACEAATTVPGEDVLGETPHPARMPMARTAIGMFKQYCDGDGEEKDRRFRRIGCFIRDLNSNQHSYRCLNSS